MRNPDTLVPDDAHGMRGVFSRRAFLGLGVALGASAMLAGLAGCSASGSASETTSIPENTYDWSRLTYAAGRAVYRDETGRKALTGIDVSSHDGDIDWPAVSADGIDFAVIRAGYRGYTEGNVHEDECFVANIQGAIAAELPIGLYFFSQAITEDEAVEEAEYICGLASSYSITYPIAYDLELNNVEDERIGHLSPSEMTRDALAFCKRVAELGYKPIIYGNSSWLDGRYDLATIANAYDIWLADYNTKPDETYQFTMWQYTDKATVDGIDNNVDLNLCFADYLTS